MRELVASPDNPVPEGAVVYSLKTRDGRRIAGRRFSLQRRARGTIALLQGHNEFIEKYFETIGELRSAASTSSRWIGAARADRSANSPTRAKAISTTSRFTSATSTFSSHRC